MSVLLRHPGAVPALFSRSLDPDELSIGRPSGRGSIRLGGSWPRGFDDGRRRRGSGFAVPSVTLLLAELPLAAAAALTLGSHVPH